MRRLWSWFGATRLQGYVSDELTHFVGRTLPTNAERFEVLLKILEEGLLKAPGDPGPPYEAALSLTPGGRICLGETYAQRAMVCFCDIPLDSLTIHIRKYGPFGVAFKKAYLVGRSATPVFYVASNSPVRVQEAGDQPGRSRSEIFNQRADEHGRLLWQLSGQSLPEGPVLPDLPNPFRNSLAELVRFEAMAMYGLVKCFDASLPDDHSDNYYMEREWRLLRRLTFTHADVARVILPKAYQKRLVRSFPDLRGMVYAV